MTLRTGRQRYEDLVRKGLRVGTSTEGEDPRSSWETDVVYKP